MTLRDAAGGMVLGGSRRRLGDRSSWDLYGHGWGWKRAGRRGVKSDVYGQLVSLGTVHVRRRDGGATRTSGRLLSSDLVAFRILNVQYKARRPVERESFGKFSLLRPRPSEWNHRFADATVI